jgi:hypothetical protein
MLTDSVFWFVIFPFLTMKDYNRNFVRTLENASTLTDIRHLSFDQNRR